MTMLVSALNMFLRNACHRFLVFDRERGVRSYIASICNLTS